MTHGMMVCFVLLYPLVAIETKETNTTQIHNMFSVIWIVIHVHLSLVHLQNLMGFNVCLGQETSSQLPEARHLGHRKEDASDNDMVSWKNKTGLLSFGHNRDRPWNVPDGNLV